MYNHGIMFLHCLVLSDKVAVKKGRRGLTTSYEAGLPAVSVIPQLFSDLSLRCINCQSKAQVAFPELWLSCRGSYFRVMENWHMVPQEAYPEAISTWENHLCYCYQENHTAAVGYI